MHLGARHQLAAQRRRQLAVGDILGEQLKSELFSELDIYEEAVEKEKQDAYDKRMYERALNGLSPPKKKAVKKKKKKSKKGYTNNNNNSPTSEDEEQDDVRRKKVVREKIDPITMAMMCQERVRKKILKEKMEQEKILNEKKLKEERVTIDKRKGRKKAAEAKRRIISRRRRKKQQEAEELNNLILKIPNSVEATNLTRLLNPEFQPQLVFNKACLDEDEERVRTIMSNIDL